MIREETKKNYTNSNYQTSAPKLRELPEIHNENDAFTSLINNQNAPAYKLAKILENLIINSIMLKTL